MLSWTSAVYPATQAGASTYWGAVARWQYNTPFSASFKIKDFRRGRSAASFILADVSGREYTMMAKYFVDAIQKSDCFKGWINGLWQFAKRGANYTLVKL